MIDNVVLGVLLVAGILGALRGAAHQLAYLVAMVTAYFGGPFLAVPLESYLPATVLNIRLPEPGAAKMVSFLILLIILRMILRLIFKHWLVGESSGRKTADRVLGFFFGAMKMGLVAYVILAFAVLMRRQIPAFRTGSVAVAMNKSSAFNFVRQHNLFAASSEFHVGLPAFEWPESKSGKRPATVSSPGEVVQKFLNDANREHQRNLEEASRSE